MGDGLWELRSSIPDGIARVIFIAQGDLMILLHGFIKKSRKTPEKELAVARKRSAALMLGGKQ
jgi:phage-related protein